jgi:hypothetical protein
MLKGGGLLAALFAVLGTLYAVFRAGSKGQQVKQLQADAKARETADQVEGDVGAMPSMEAREELKKWSSD